jgi:hypothetical protein
MNKRALIGIAVGVVVIGAVVLFGYRHWSHSQDNQVNGVLAQMPSDANAVVYFDLEGLRQSPFLTKLYRWAPQPTADSDYSQFMQSTGFNYERDLNRVSIATLKRGNDTTLFAVAEGNFDRKRISAYALQTGERENQGKHEIFSVPASSSKGGSKGRITFTFLRNERIALTNGADLESLLREPHDDSDTLAWRERFRRLAGSPVFVVIRQDAAAGTIFGSRAPGGLQSPQLSGLLDQLQWITIAGKPAADHLRVVLEGEATTEATTRQLSDVLNGLFTLAQAGLSDPKMRQKLQPQVRDAYLETLKSADVSRVDRGETKAVRLIFDLTPEFLEAARASVPQVPPGQEGKALRAKPTIRN